MTKKQTAKVATPKKKVSASGQDATTTFSTRLTSEEKELIGRAAKIRKAVTPKKKASASGRDATTTFCTRLTAQEKELIRRAAKIRKWSPSKLVRMASVERAANIVNIHESNSRRELKDLAVHVARQLWAPHLEVEGDVQMGEEPVVLVERAVELGAVERGIKPYRDVEPSSMEAHHLEEMRDGLLYGGVEFLAQIVRAGDSHFEPPLPPPVDPTSLNEPSDSGDGQ